MVWSYVTIHVKKMTAKYDPLVVTGTGMALGALPTLPAALIWMHVTGETVVFSANVILPVLYICLVCTAFAHYMWNHALSRGTATNCAAFYPFQPVTSMLLGVVLLGEECSVAFLAGTAMILFSIVLRQTGGHLPHLHRHKKCMLQHKKVQAAA